MAGQQPDEQQATLVVMADMRKSVAVLGIVEALIFDLPAALGHCAEAAAAHTMRGEVAQPIGLDDFAVAMVLAITDHAHGVPLPGFPRVKGVSIQDLNVIAAVPELQIRRLGAKALLRRLE